LLSIAAVERETGHAAHRMDAAAVAEWRSRPTA
jgi:hypothetical protein